MAAVRNGVKPVWSSEIEAFPIALTKIRFPDTIQLGDITKIDGAKIPPVDIICMGSPCQDLSVAGKREGLKGERSGLFRTAIDVVRSMRDATNGLYPKVVIWENVPGAFTSNEGMDFRAVLDEFTEREIPMPKSERWASAEMVRSGRCDVAWRCFDAQYWGVPQRRNRIFLVADFRETGRCAAEILFKCEGLQGDNPQSERTRKRTTSTIEKSIRTASDVQYGGAKVVKIRSGKDDGTAGKGALIGIEQSFTLGCANDQTLFQEKITSTAGGHNEPQVYENHAQDYRVKRVEVAPTMGIHATMNPTLVMESIPNKSYCTAGNSIDRQIQNGCNGKGVIEEQSYTLNTIDRHAVVQPMSNGGGTECILRGQRTSTSDVLTEESRNAELHERTTICSASNGQEVIGTLCAGDWKGPGNQYVKDGKLIVEQITLADKVSSLCACDNATQNQYGCRKAGYCT